MKIIYIPILNDNYVWIMINHKNFCIIVDPGGNDALILNSIKKLNIHPVAILVTHFHSDHVMGIKKLIKMYPKLFVYGPKEAKKFGVNKICKNNTFIKILNYKFQVIFTPGHTEGHISYYKNPYLFCGDTLFSGGCGKIADGMLLKAYNSLNKLKRLPNETLIYCTHEYTLQNLKFSKSIFKNNAILSKLYKKTYNMRLENKCSLPSTLKIEKKINPFLNLNTLEVKNYTKIHKDLMFGSNILYKLRKMKEEYK
ncbi:MAG: hydroxyacylglutathione hydrolase [Buchnera aphidicola (Nurudea ibofushi)]